MDIRVRIFYQEPFNRTHKFDLTITYIYIHLKVSFNNVRLDYILFIV